MNLGTTLKGLSRRWLILVVGLILAMGSSLGVWAIVHPTYERSATLLLLPGKGSLPSGSQNPFLFLGGLTFAADIVVRATGSENVQHQLEIDHPGASIEVIRDPTTAGPVIRITVTGTSSEESDVVLNLLTDEAATVLHNLQAAENIGPSQQITTVVVTKDDHAVTGNRMRIALSGAAGLMVVGLSVLVASTLEGLSTRRGSKSGVRTAAKRGVAHPDDVTAGPQEESANEDAAIVDVRLEESSPVPQDDEVLVPTARTDL